MQDNITSATLDLARAYVNMGEGLRAKAMLEEVIAKGTAQEKREAEGLLARIK